MLLLKDAVLFNTGKPLGDAIHRKNHAEIPHLYGSGRMQAVNAFVEVGKLFRLIL